jgi:transposase
MLANCPALSPETEGMEEVPEIEHRGRPKSDGKSLERRSPSMKKKHTYQSADVDAIDVAALVARVVAACAVPGPAVPGICIVAVDVAKETFFAALSNERGEVVRILRFHHPKQTTAFLKLLLTLRSEKLDVQVVLEPTGTYGDSVKHQCHQRGLAVYEVSPKRTHDMAEVLDGVPSMHDAKSTVVLAQLHAMGKSRKWQPYSDTRRELRALVDRRVLYSDPLERHYGRLEALLTRFWPEFGQVMDVRMCRSWMSLLSKYPGPEAVLHGSLDASVVLREAASGALSIDRIDEIIGAATGSLGVPMTNEERVLLSELVLEIQRLQTKLDEIDRQLASHIKSDTVMKPIACAVGPAATAALFAFVGAPGQYDSASAYEKACGLNLKVRSSGTHEGRLTITKRGPPRVRQLLYLAALRLCRSDAVVRAWYHQRGGHKANAKTKAVVAVMRKLVRALWCMGRDVQDLREFDSLKLFDSRRLGIGQHSTESASSLSQSADASPQAASSSKSCSAQTKTRIDRSPLQRKPSGAEDRP